MQNNIPDQKDITPSSITPSSITPSSITPSSITPSSITPSSITPSSEPNLTPSLESESNTVTPPPNQIENFIKYTVKILYYIIYGLSWGNISINPYKSTYIIKFGFYLIIFIIILLSTGYGATSILSNVYNISDINDNDKNNKNKNLSNDIPTTSNYIVNQIKLFLSDTYNLFIKGRVTIPTLPFNDLSFNDLSFNDISFNDLSFNDLSFNDISFNDMEKSKYNKEYLKNYNKNMIRLVVIQLIGFIFIFFILIFTMICLNDNINKNGYNFFYKILELEKTEIKPILVNQPISTSQSSTVTPPPIANV